VRNEIILLLLVVVAISPFGITPCLSAETDSAASPSSTAAVVSRYLGALDESPYHHALKRCFDESPGNAQKLVLPDLPEDPELVALIACSSVMDIAEKQYWFDVLPNMTGAQKARLLDTLATQLRRDIDPIRKELGALGEGLRPPVGSRQ